MNFDEDPLERVKIGSKALYTPNDLIELQDELEYF